MNLRRRDRRSALHRVRRQDQTGRRRLPRVRAALAVHVRPRDLVWWLGGTKTIVRAALADLGAVAVPLDGGGAGWLLPDDLAEVPDPGPWVALLPVLDPTVMGWRGRDFYLGPHRDQLFDLRGNAGTTAWADDRVVGCWVQDDAGVVEVRLLERVPASTRRALAARLTAWLAGLRVGSVYGSPAMRAG